MFSGFTEGTTMSAPGTVLILDADSVLSLALTDELAAAGYRIIAHTRAAPRTPLSSHVIHAACAEAAERISLRNEACGPLTHAPSKSECRTRLLPVRQQTVYMRLEYSFPARMYR